MMSIGGILSIQIINPDLKKTNKNRNIMIIFTIMFDPIVKKQIDFNKKII